MSYEDNIFSYSASLTYRTSKSSKLMAEYCNLHEKEKPFNFLVLGVRFFGESLSCGFGAIKVFDIKENDITPYLNFSYHF